MNGQQDFFHETVALGLCFINEQTVATVRKNTFSRLALRTRSKKQPAKAYEAHFFTKGVRGYAKL